MKKEFGKWFLDLAKYILTAIILTAFLGEMERTIVLWGALIFFLVSLVIGYVLLRQSDQEKLSVQQVPILPNKQPADSETKVTEKTDTIVNKRKKSNKKSKK